MIALACDHTGVEMKNVIRAMVEEMGYACKDFGNYETAGGDDYPVFGYRAAKAVASGECDRGILICGTGVGIGLAANKVNGIRCCICSEAFSAELSKRHNNSNMISFGSRVVGIEVAKMIVSSWLNASFEGGRHARRVDMLASIERGEAIE